MLIAPVRSAVVSDDIARAVSKGLTRACGCMEENKVSAREYDSIINSRVFFFQFWK
jgi:hypothetical protein